MSVLTAKIKLVDDMSEKLKNLGTNGKDVEEQLKNIGTTANSLGKVSEEAEKSTQAFTETSKVVQEYNEWHEKSLDALSDYINGVEDSKDELDKFIGTTEKSSEETEKFNEKLKGSQKEHQETQKETKKTTEETEEYGKTNEEVFGELENLVASAGVIVFLKQVYDGYIQCIEAASTFETSMAKVSTLSDPNIMSMDLMGDDILELSNKTGQAASELAEAEYQALSAGVAQKSAAEFVEQANQLAVGGFTEAATSVDVLTTALNAYQLDVSETNRVSDTLIMTQNLGKTTVDELAQNMGRVIPSAAAYNVQIEDLSTAYALLTANGIATAESTTYLKGMFNELGDTGSVVSTTLQEETGKSFDMLIQDGYSLGDIIGVLSDSVDGNATSFANLWASQEAGIGALSLLTSGTEKYNSTLEKMNNASGTAAEAYEKMTNTSEHTSKALQTAGTNLQIALGNAMLPATNQFNEVITKVLNGLTTFVNTHPEVVQALSSIAVSISVVTVAITAYTAATKIAKIATAAFTAVMDANPIFLVATAIAAVVAGLATFSASQQETVEEVETLSAASKQQKDELAQLQYQYDSLCDSGQKNSAEAEELKVKIDDLSSAYESNKQTVDELWESHDQLMQKYEEFKSSHEEQVEKISDEEDSANNLIERLEELASKSNLTAEEQAEMGIVIDALNRKIPDLGVTYSVVASDVEGSMDRIKKAVNQDISQKKYDEAYSTYSGAFAQADDLKDNKDKAKKQLDEAQTLYNNAEAMVQQAKSRKDQFLQEGDIFNWLFSGDYDISSAEEHMNAMKEDLDIAQNKYEEAQNAFDDNNQKMEDAWDDMVAYSAESYGLITETESAAQDAVTGIAPSIIESVMEVATAYDEAYNSALSSFQGQYSLWDEVDDISATSASTLISNLDSQISYWENYANNLESLQNRNIEGLDRLLASIDDGSEESAAALAGMANASDSELQKMVDKYGKLQDEQGKTATNVAELETDFSDKMDKIAKDAETTIDKMNLSDEATASATSTMNAYINAIKNADVAGAVAEKVNSAKSLLNVGTNSDSGKTSSSVPGHAKGTTNAEDVFIAGEEGPELVVGHAGATVYTADETEKIINRSYNVPDTSFSSEITPVSYESEVKASDEKVIILKLEGLGAIQISGSGGVDKNDIVDILTEQIKPVLIGVLNDEIYEEGDDSYEY